jgi:hypothetical protein
MAPGAAAGPTQQQRPAGLSAADPSGDVWVNAELGQPPPEQVAAVDLRRVTVSRRAGGLRIGLRLAAAPLEGAYYPVVTFSAMDRSDPVGDFGLSTGGKPLRPQNADAYYQRSHDSNDVVVCRVDLSVRGSTVRIDVPKRCTPPVAPGVVKASAVLMAKGEPYDIAASDDLRFPGTPSIPAS